MKAVKPPIFPIYLKKAHICPIFSRDLSYFGVCTVYCMLVDSYTFSPMSKILLNF